MSRTQVLFTAAGVAVVGLAIGIYVRLLPSGNTGSSEELQGSALTFERAIEPLRSDATLPTCKLVIRNVNNFAERNPKLLEMAPSAEQKAVTAKTLEGFPEEIRLSYSGEINGTRLTMMDAHYLELCLLLRDAARSLPKSPTTAEQAEIAFHWSMRQVMVQPSEDDPERPKLSMDDVLLIPPEVVLRFGFGTPLDPELAIFSASPELARRRGFPDELQRTLLPAELVQRVKRGARMQRAVVFLLLLRQLGIEGCLIGSANGKSTEYWACGVLDGKEILVFDPRLAMPLPGPKGKGMATLKQLRADPSLPSRLGFGKEDGYDVTAEQVKRAEAHLIAPISSLSARMRAFNEALTKGSIPVSLAVNLPELTEAFQGGMRHAGHDDPQVKLAPWSIGAQYGYYPKSEGGRGDAAHRGRVEAQVAPISVLIRALPPQFLRGAGGVIQFDATGSRLFESFTERFRSLTYEPGKARDLVLRGQYDKADHALGDLRSSSSLARRSYEAADKEALAGDLIEWGKAYRRLLVQGSDEEQVNRIAQRYGESLNTFFYGVAAEEMLARVLYLSGLSHQEQAEKKYFALLHSDKVRDLAALEDARAPWLAAKSAWRTYGQHHGGRFLPFAARWHNARAQQALAHLYELSAAIETDETKKENWLSSAGKARQTSIDLWTQLADEHKGLLRLHCRHQIKTLQRSAQ